MFVYVEVNAKFYFSLKQKETDQKNRLINWKMLWVLHVWRSWQRSPLLILVSLKLLLVLLYIRISYCTPLSLSRPPLSLSLPLSPLLSSSPSLSLTYECISTPSSRSRRTGRRRRSTSQRIQASKTAEWMLEEERGREVERGKGQGEREKGRGREGGERQSRGEQDRRYWTEAYQGHTGFPISHLRISVTSAVALCIQLTIK